MTSLAVDTEQPEIISNKVWIGFIGMVVGMFMAILDIQIVASSLQSIQAGLSATEDEIAWIQTAYLIAEVIIIPLSGWLARALSTRYLFTMACGGFTLMSIACAFSSSLNAMVVFRLFQGLFGGVMIPTVFSTIFTLFPTKLHAKLTVVVGLVVTVAPTAGPILGGYLTEITSWHTLFLINIIPGILVCLTTWRFVDVDKPDLSLFKIIDYWGIAFISIFLGSIEYVLEEGAKKGWFESVEITLLTVISAISFFAMLRQELTCENPIVDLRALKNKNFAIGCTFSFIIGWGLFSVVLITPLYLAGIMHLNSYQIGSYVMVTGIFQFVSAPLAGMTVDKIDSRLMLGIGLFGFGLGSLINANLTNQSGYWDFFLPQAIRGLSLMFCFLPINTLALGTLPVEQVKNASGLYNLMRNLGGAIGLAISNTYLVHANKAYYAVIHDGLSTGHLKAQQALHDLAQYFNGIDPTHAKLMATKLLYLQAMRESSIISYNHVFSDISLLFFCGILLIFAIDKVDEDHDKNKDL